MQELAESLGYESVREMLAALYYGKGLSVREMSSFLGVSAPTLTKTIKQIGLPLKDPERRRPSQFPCPQCGSEETIILVSRKLSGRIKRIRECRACKTRFNTYEKLGEVLEDV